LLTEAENRLPYILVADDGSTESRAAAEAAIQIARRNNLAVRGLYVVDEALALDTYADYYAELPLLPRVSDGERPAPASRAELISWFETQGETALARLQTACSEAGVPVATSLLAGGVTEMVICNAAEAQMLALGRRGHRHRKDLQSLGRNFRKIAHRVQLPMLVGGLPRPSLQRLLVAYHGLASADEALCWAARLQRELAAEVIVLCVCGDDKACLSGTRLKKIKARLAQSDLDGFRFITGHGRPADAAAAAAAANDVDLIILGRYRHGALVEWLVGSTVDRLLRSSSLPILIA